MRLSWWVLFVLIAKEVEGLLPKENGCDGNTGLVVIVDRDLIQIVAEFGTRASRQRAIASKGDGIQSADRAGRADPKSKRETKSAIIERKT